jgi:hypothetical protein
MAEAFITIEKSDGSTVRWGVSDHLADQALKLIAGDAPAPKRKYDRSKEATWKRRGKARTIPFTTAQLEQALTLRDEGVTITEIARRLDLSIWSLRRDLILYDKDPAELIDRLTPDPPIAETVE